MPTVTLNAATGTFKVSSQSNSFASAVSGVNLSTTASFSSAGQVGCVYSTPSANDYAVFQNHLSFDTSGIPVGSIINAATFRVYPWSLNSSNWTIEVRGYAAGAVATDDWRTPSDLASYTLLATLAAGAANTSGYNAFTESGSNLRSYINPGGITQFILASADNRTSTAPTPDGTFNQLSYWDASDGTRMPTLEVTYTLPVHLGAAVLPATVTLSAAGRAIKQGAVALATSLGIASAGATTQHGAAALDLSAALATAGTMSRTSGVLMPATATIAVDAQVGAILGEAALALATTLSPRAGITQHAQQAIAAGVTLQAEAVLGRPPPLILKSVRPQAGTGSYGILPAAGSGRRR